jgi:arylsulfatase A-like enzyme
MRPPTLTGLALPLILAACSCSRGPEPLPVPDHVLLIVVDTLRADHLSTYGYGRPTSPVLDALARESVVFENAVSQGSYTGPSMVSLMTGRWLAEETLAIPTGTPTLASAFRDGGYETGAFIYNNLLSRDNGFASGFHHFEYEDPPYQSDAPILAWIEQVRGKKSFTFVHLNEAHDPYGATDGKWPRDGVVRFMNERKGLDRDRSEYYDAISAREGLQNGQQSRAHIEAQIGAYDDDIAHTDARIGRILDAYRAAGLWERTAVVVASDHGEGLWTRLDFLAGKRLNAVREGRPTLVDALQMTHGNLVNVELVHVPLILRAPGLAPRRVEEYVENVDIAPTLLDLCGLAVPTAHNGTSLLETKHRAGGFTHTRYVSSLIDDGLHLIVPTPLGECQFGLEVELFDMERDPRERTNLAAERPQLVARMRGEIESRMAKGLQAGDHTYSAETLATLAALGYIDSGIVDTLAAEFDELTPEVLLAKLANPSESNNCLVRLELVRALARRPLTDDQRTRLAELRAKEVSEAVKSAFDRALAR